MDVRRMIWVGIKTPRYEETVSFFRDLLDLAVVFEGSNWVEVLGPNGHRYEFATRK